MAVRNSQGGTGGNSSSVNLGTGTRRVASQLPGTGGNSGSVNLSSLLGSLRRARTSQLPGTGGNSGSIPSTNTVAQSHRIAQQQSGPTAVDAGNSAADDFTSGRTGKQEQDEQEQRDLEMSAASPDDFYTAFQLYSDNNLGGQDIYDFMVTDGSQGDRDAWRAMTSDPIMGRYYSDAIDAAGGFDPWYDQMTGNTIDDVMGSMDLQRQYFGLDDDTVNAIFNGAANDANGMFLPAISGDDDNAQYLAALYESEPDLAARTMAYQYVMNAMAADPEIASHGLTLDEVNNLAGLDQMEFGYGDDYGWDEVGDLPTLESTLAVDPQFYVDSANQMYSSTPGYGIPISGLNSLVLDRYQGAGYRRRPGVDDLYAEYMSQQGGDEQ